MCLDLTKMTNQNFSWCVFAKCRTAAGLNGGNKMENELWFLCWYSLLTYTIPSFHETQAVDICSHKSVSPAFSMSANSAICQLKVSAPGIPWASILVSWVSGVGEQFIPILFSWCSLLQVVRSLPEIIVADGSRQWMLKIRLRQRLMTVWNFVIVVFTFLHTIYFQSSTSYCAEESELCPWADVFEASNVPQWNEWGLCLADTGILPLKS